MSDTRLIDANLLETNIAQIARKCARSDAQKALVGRILFMIENMPTIEAQPAKCGRRIDHEKLIGIFGTLCDYMVDNGRCDVFCPYADTKDENDECEAWRTIQEIRREVKNETD